MAPSPEIQALAQDLRRSSSHHQWARVLSTREHILVDVLWDDVEDTGILEVFMEIVTRPINVSTRATLHYVDYGRL